MTKAKLGSGARFKSLEKKVEKEGYSKESAQKIAAAAGREKYGDKKMAAMSAKGRKKK